jgi:GNAT superfamily N-acetyltransferase
MPVDTIQAAIKAETEAAAKAASETTCVPAPHPSDAAEAVTLRRATSADAAALALVGSATFLEAFTWMLPGADIVAHCAQHHTAAAYEKYLQEPSTRITLAVTAGGAPVGYAMLTAPDLPTFAVLPTDIELKRIYLFSRFRGAPVLTPPSTAQAGSPIPELHAVQALRPAQGLMNAMVADALALGCTRLLLGTHAGNLRAIAFYRRNGFAEAGTRTFQVGSQRCCDLIFAKPL